MRLSIPFTGSRRSSRPANPGEAFEAEALSFIDRLYGAAIRLTHNRVDAEDLVYATYDQAFRSADRFERRADLKAWLFTILHSTYRNGCRRAGHDPVDFDSDAVEQAAVLSDPGERSDPRMMWTISDADLKATFDSLPDPLQQAIWLRDVEDFSYAQIAQMLAVPVATVLSCISRGRRLLYERLSVRPRRARPR